MYLYTTHGSRLYDEESTVIGDLYDVADRLTDGFRNISADAIQTDPRIVRPLRYMMKPVISQMKLGQHLGRSSTGSFETDVRDEAVTPSDAEAARLANFFEANLDTAKTPWVEDSCTVSPAVRRMGRDWICDKLSEQAARTRYRNWRRDFQEDAVARALSKSGYKQASPSGTIDSISDIQPGTFVGESKIDGQVIQKADFIVRSSDELVLIEAKAIGVRVDAHKRVKEIRNKASDWRAEFDMVRPVTVVAGELPTEKAVGLADDGIDVYWSHRLQYDFSEDMRMINPNMK